MNIDALAAKVTPELVERYARDARSLTTGEQQRLESVFFGDVDYGRIRTARGGLVTVFGRVMTLYNLISYPEGDYVDDFSVGIFEIFNVTLMSHEVAHIWQHQTLEYHSWIRCLVEQILYGKDVYRYEPPDPVKALVDYRFEQQGAIVLCLGSRRAGPAADNGDYVAMPGPPD